MYNSITRIQSIKQAISRYNENSNAEEIVRQSNQFGHNTNQKDMQFLISKKKKNIHPLPLSLPHDYLYGTTLTTKWKAFLPVSRTIEVHN